MRLIEALEQVVRRHPDGRAVEGECSLSYAELWVLAGEEAARLKRSEQSWTIVQGSRGIDFLGRLLGAWRADKVPLILDFKTPVARVEELTDLLRRESISEEAEYLCSTSGSTGFPRVVMVGKGSLLAMARQQTEAFELSKDSRFLWMLSTGFDASLSDISTTLLSGACLICAGDWCGELASKLEEHKISHVDIPPSVLRLYKPDQFPQCLQTIILGGEPSNPSTLRKWSSRYRMVAIYGPTEATVCSSLSVVDEDWDQPYIGQPLDGVFYRVEQSELLIGGRQVALGYLGNSKDERFYQEGGSRWYRTGDLVRESNSLHGHRFLARVDRQVQRNGQRLELAEVEYYAGMISDRSSVAAVMLEGRLVLFWERREELAEADLRLHLERFLPRGSCPDIYFGVAKLPRHPSGKVDFERLQVRNSGLGQMSSLQRLDHLVRLERESEGMSAASLSEEVRGALRQPRLRCSPSEIVRSVLVTGATGRLGRVLLPRLVSEFSVWRLSRRECDSRTLRGDLEKPLLGLTQDKWDFLKTEVDMVVNLAGCLDIHRDFEELRGVNLDGVSRLMELGKPIVHASTLATTLCAEPATLAGVPETVFGGYAQTKWAADQLLEVVSWPGLSLRYGQLLAKPDSEELLCQVVQGLIELGAYPSGDGSKDWCFDITPTDWAAEQTLERILRGIPSPRESPIVRRGWTLHFEHLIEVLKEQNHQLTALPFDQFRALPAHTRATQIAQLAFSNHRQWSPFLWGNLESGVQVSREALEILSAYVSGMPSKVKLESLDEA